MIKNIAAFAALIMACVLALLSHWATDGITANMLILIAQFLMYSLTLFGFGELVQQIIKMTKK